jgi:hypothetical protein
MGHRSSLIGGPVFGVHYTVSEPGLPAFGPARASSPAKTPHLRVAW